MQRRHAARCTKFNRDACFTVMLRGALGVRMIPTLRSMIVAMLLAMVALGGGFGLFAAFRINHAPARLASAARRRRRGGEGAGGGGGGGGGGGWVGWGVGGSEALLAS